MEGFLIRAVVVGIGLWLASMIGFVQFRTPGALIAAALLLGVVNAVVRPVLIILTFPITLLTLGLFLLVINGLMIELVSWFLGDSFVVLGFWPAFFAAIVVSLTSWVMSGWVGGPQNKGRIDVITMKQTGPNRWE